MKFSSLTKLSRPIVLSILLVGMLAPFARTAWAHSVAQLETAVYFDPPTIRFLQTRAAAGMGGIRVGDELSYIIEFLPVENGATVGAGGYVTAYIPDGLRVIGAEHVRRDGSAFVPTTPNLPGPTWTGSGGDGAFPGWMTIDPAVVAGCGLTPLDDCQGRMMMVYADTGVFYSRAASTALFTSMDPEGIARVSNGYHVDPSAEGQLAGDLGFPGGNARTHNLWDASQTNAFGGSVPGVTPRSDDINLGEERGNTPYGAGSPVAGVDTGYRLDNTGAVGPWRRIAHPGSTTSVLGTPATDDGTVGYFAQATSGGVTVSPTSPAPADVNAVRWAVGRLNVGEIRHVRLRVRVTAPPPAEGFVINSEVFGGDSANAAGKDNKDNPWRYHVPSIAHTRGAQIAVTLTPVLVNGAPYLGGAVPPNATVRYRLSYVNFGSAPHTDVVLTLDTPPETAACPVTNFVVTSGSAAVLPTTPTCPTLGSGDALAFGTIPSLVAGAGGSIEFDLVTSSAGDDLVLTSATIDSDENPEPIETASAFYVADEPFLTYAASGSPTPTSAGSEVTYTLRVTNNGSAATRSPLTFRWVLPTSGPGAGERFTFVLGSSTFTGLPPTTPTVADPPTLEPYGAEPRQQLTWDFGAATIAADATVTIQFRATIGASVPEMSAAYFSAVEVEYGNSNGPFFVRGGLEAPIVVLGDADGDGVGDSVDVDEDNDGVLDDDESPGFPGDPSDDQDSDGVPDWADPDHTPGGCTAAGLPARCVTLPASIDADGDGVPNHRDLDSDGDGITDALESGSRDNDGDGDLDLCSSVNAMGVCLDAGGTSLLRLMPTNTDRATPGGDAIPDYLDPDSDADGLRDSVEAYDRDGDGIIAPTERSALGNDHDSDGIDDAFDPDCTGVGTPAGCVGAGSGVTSPLAMFRDADGDGTPDWQQVCGDAYVTGAEGCDAAGASAMCTAMCLLVDGEVCTEGRFCDSGVCTTGICSAASLDLADPDAGGPLTTTSVTPTGSSTGFVVGAMIAVTVTGPGVTAMCSAMVAAGGGWTCSTAITGLQPGATYVATARGTADGVPLTDVESFTLSPCAGRDSGEMCMVGAMTGVCDMDGGTGECVRCADTMTGSGQDSGCGASAPICADIAGAPTCVACVDSTSGGEDLGCSAAVGPVCDDSNPAAPVCVACEDNVAGDMMDNGCMGDASLCVEPVGSAPMCVECMSDAQCTTPGEVCNGDNTCVPGCADMADCAGTPLPICDVPERTCVECLTDADCPGVTVCSGGGMCRFDDSDGDRVPDDVDLDDDNDGILDADELGGEDESGDANDNGVPDYIDAALTGCDDGDGDGVCDAIPAEFDFDADGIPNHLDRDADGDGIADAIEGDGADDDGDGIIDGFADANGNGYADALEASPLAIPNTDGTDGPDFLDLDADGDGLTDTLEAGGTDVDGDGVPDGPNADVDRDGLADLLSGMLALPVPDTDGDGDADFRDVDSDGDGLPDTLEAFDMDRDGVADASPADSDSDMDGLDDAFDPDCAAAADCGGVIGFVAPEPNEDADPFPNWRDIDSDGDGITDDIECPASAMCADSDGDGTPDVLELDSDDDGLPDASEGHDADHDGIPDVEPEGLDTDGDGLDDAFDADCATAADCLGTIGVPAPTPDLDMDDTPNFQDEDDDADSILTSTEIADAAAYVGPATMPTDVDEDGLPNWYDTDSDGDEIPDVTEDSRPELDGDLDDNGILDYLDPGFAPADTDMDTILDALECPGLAIPDDTCPDSDGDGTPDFLDVDDDNDGIPTIIEYGAADPDDGDPVNDHDADNDGVPNHLDLDADNDGIPDLTENGGALLDADGDGRVDAPVDADGDGLLSVFDEDDADPAIIATMAPTNTDGSGPADYLDLDADDDGLLDIFEADGVDVDGDGRVDDPADADDDGLADLVDGTPWPTPDTDDDGAFDFQDVDTDGDGVPDVNEGNDADEDGRADWMASESDTDGDGIDDAFEAAMMAGAPALPDTDGDGTANWRDLDDDGDSIPTAGEDLDRDGEFGDDDTDDDGAPNFLDADDDGDTVDTRFENPDPDGDGNPLDGQDTDGDGVPDYLDTDDDGDSVLTRFENPDPNGDGDPRDDGQDTDGDGTPDYLDPDDDGDGIPTIDEMPDPNGDGDPADALDSDGDAIPDYLDAGDVIPPTMGGISGGALCSATPGGSSGGFLLMLGLAWVLTRRRRSRG